MFVDTHAHLFFDNFNGELDEIISRAKEAGVEYILVPGTDIKTSRQAIALAEKYENVFASVGVHPHDSKDWSDEDLAALTEMADHPKVVALGEMGLDYYYDFSPREKQIEAFEEQLNLALIKNKPVIIHNREANDDTMSIIREFTDTNLKAQLHCFAGTLEEAKELIGMGHLISFPGNLTFKKMEQLREIVRNLKLENLLLETDCPFMTPVPHRGKRNEPAYVPLVAEKIAELYDIPIEEVGRVTSNNAFKLFGIGKLKD